MTIRPGRGVLWCAGAALLAVAFSLQWTALLWAIPAVMGAAMLMAILDFRQISSSWNCVGVRRTLPVFVRRGSPFKLSLHVKNSSNLPVVGIMRDVRPAEAEPQLMLQTVRAGPGEEPEFSSELRIATRGLYNFGPVWLRLAGRFKILEGQKEFQCLSELKVLPDTARSKEGLRSDDTEAQLRDELTQTRLHGAGLEFESLAEYNAGDDPRRIDWRSSARHRHLVVRRYQLEQHRDVVIVLDCGRLMGAATGQGTKLDRAVDSALMLSRVALQKGDRCGLGLFDDKVIGYLPPISGAGAQSAIMERVYNVQSRWRESNFTPMFATLQARQIKRSLVVVLSDIVDGATSKPFRAGLAALTKRHLVVFAALQTPLLAELVAAESGSFLDVSRKTVVLRLLRERKNALFELSRSGVHILDVEPTELTVPLVNRYIELRERNLL